VVFSIKAICALLGSSLLLSHLDSIRRKNPYEKKNPKEDKKTIRIIFLKSAFIVL